MPETGLEVEVGGVGGGSCFFLPVLLNRSSEGRREKMDENQLRLVTGESSTGEGGVSRAEDEEGEWPFSGLKRTLWKRGD